MISLLTNGLSDRCKDALIDRYIPQDIEIEWVSPTSTISPSSNLVVALGMKTWSYTWGSMDWRGFIGPKKYRDRPVFLTITPAEAHKYVWGHHAMREDWGRITRFLEGKWPLPVPDIVEVSHHTIPRMSEWFTRAEVAPWCVVDCEWNPGTKQLYHIGLSTPNDSTMHIDWRTCDPDAKGVFFDKFRHLITVTPIIFHNALADVPVLRDTMGEWAGWEGYRRVDDTCLLHACLYPGYPHDLEWVASIWGMYPKMKHLKHIDPVRYNQGDVLETGAIYEALSMFTMGDAGATRDYATRLRLLPEIEHRMREGVLVGDRKRAKKDIPKWVAEYQAEATRVVGEPTNLNSPAQVKKHMKKFPQVVQLRERVMALRRVKKEFRVA